MHTNKFICNSHCINIHFKQFNNISGALLLFSQIYYNALMLSTKKPYAPILSL